MFGKLQIMQTAGALAAHAGARQALVAANVANADTPGYRARDLQAFSERYGGGATDAGGWQARATRPGHAGSGLAASVPGFDTIVDASAQSPNGNSVSLEAEMVRAADIRQQHDLALSVYRASSDILRASLGRST